MRKLFAWIAVLIIFLSAFSAHAEDRLFNLSLEELLEVPISGATLFDETRDTVPSSVTVFNREKIRRLGMETLAELANLVPGFQVLRSSENAAYSMASARGRRISASSSEILLLIDGRRTQNVRVAGLATFLEFPLSLVERVEFIRGPGSALHGSGAMMGVINVVTRSEESELTLSAGNFGNTRASMLGQKSSADSFVDLLVDYQRSRGQRYDLPDTFTSEPLTVKDSSTAAHVALKAGIGSVSGSVRMQEQRYEGFYTLGYADPNGETLNRFCLIDLDYVWQAGDFDSKTSIVVSNSLNKTFIRVSPPGQYSEISEPQSDAAHRVKTTHEVEEYEISHQVRWQKNKSNRFVMGGELTENELVHDEVAANFDTNTSPVSSSEGLDFKNSIYNIHENASFAFYGQWQHRLSDTSELTMGMRYDENREISKGSFSPRFTWVKSLNAHHSFKLIYGEAFRAPNMHERGLKSNGLIASNPNLKPETITTTELVWVGDSEHWLWSLGYFYNQFDQAIVQEVLVDGENAGVRAFTNGEIDDSSGLEAELEYRNGGFSAQLSATSMNNLDELSFRESSELASLTLNYSRSRWNLNVYAVYRGDRGQSRTDQDSLEAYWLSGAKLKYEFPLWGGLELMVRNLANSTVYYPAQGGGLPNGTPSRTREVFLAWVWDF